MMGEDRQVKNERFIQVESEKWKMRGGERCVSADRSSMMGEK